MGETEMPREKRWRPRQVSNQDEWRYQEWCAQAPDVAAVRRAVNDLKVFMVANPTYRTLPADTVFGMAGAQMSNDGMLTSSIRTVIRIWKDHRVDPACPDDALSRLDSGMVMKGLAREAATIGVTYVKALFSPVLLGSLTYARIPRVAPTRRQAEAHAKYQYFWWLCCVTGNRPAHVRSVRSVRLTAEGVYVLWGPRKIRVESPTAELFYPHSWVNLPAPTPELLQNAIWFQGTAPDLSNSKMIASCLDRWLRLVAESRNITHHVSSGCARVMVSAAYARRVQAGLLREIDFEILLDHTYATYVNKYARREVIA